MKQFKLFMENGETISPLNLAKRLNNLPGFVFLDSAIENKLNKSFSLITAFPRKIHEGNIFNKSHFKSLEELFLKEKHAYKCKSNNFNFPVPGLYGYVEYEGDFVFGNYSWGCVFNHLNKSWSIIGKEPKEFLKIKNNPYKNNYYTKPKLGKIYQEMKKKEFFEKIFSIKESIKKGDIYQVNISHRFHSEILKKGNLFKIYDDLRKSSPAPFSAMLKLKDKTIISSSPEEFLFISNKKIQTRPIKGTRPRFNDIKKDNKSKKDLINSYKEKSELIMITDLERNDLGKICEFGSIEVLKILELEEFAQVFHLVSTIQGNLRPEINHIKSFLECFPGGSITGAPKRKAMEIIKTLEPIPRGIYTGAIGGFGFNNVSKFNIAIRTIVIESNVLHFHVGSGIVNDSFPQREWEETFHKAKGILKSLGQ